MGCGDSGNDDTQTPAGDGDGDGDAAHDAGQGDGDGDGDDQPDAGDKVDAGAMSDAGSADMDSGVSQMDAGEADSGTDESDAGRQSDAAVADDAGTVADSGTSDDAGTCAAPDAALGPQGPNRALGAEALPSEGCDSPGAEGAPNLIDGVDGSKWLCRQATPFISVVFPGGATYAVNAYSLTSGNDALERDPKNWKLQGSNDGTNWVTVDSRTNQGFTLRGQTRSFFFRNCQAFARYRLLVQANNGADIFQLAELKLYGEPGPVLPTGKAFGGTVTSDCPNMDNAAEDAPSAFDGKASTKWFCGGHTAVTVAYDFKDEESYAITSYTITAANDSADRDPKSWVVEASDDGENWTALEPAQNDQVFVERYQTVTYPLTNSTAYKQYRFKITANNGSVDFQVADFALFE
jgi:hypothetical protein